MLVDPMIEEARTLLKSRLQQGIQASSLCTAVVGWLCEAKTNPAIADIRRAPEGRIWLRLSDETTLEPFCSDSDFSNQVRVICHSLGLTEEQTAHMVAFARHRLG